MAVKHLQVWPRAGTGQLSNSSRAILDQLFRLSFVAFCLFVFFLVAFPSYGELKLGGSPNLAPSRLLRLAMLGLMTLIMMIKPFRQSLTRQDERDARILYWLVVAFWLWTLPLVLFNAVSFGYTISKLRNEVIPVWISFWLTVALVRRRDQFDWVINALALSTIVLLCVLGAEVFLRRNVFDGLLQVENLSTGLAFIEEMRDGRYRAKGTFQHALVLAHFLVSFGLLFLSKGIFHPKPMGAGLKWWVLGVVCLGCVYFTNTRSGLAIGALFGVLLLSLRYMVWLKGFANRLMATMLRLQLLWLPFLTGGVAYFLADMFAGRSEAERSSTSTRMLTIFNALGNLGESPLIGFGVGLGDTKGGTSYAGGYMYTVDNLFLLQTLDHGIPAALLLLACFGYCAWRITPRWRDWRPSEDVGLRVGILFVIMTTIVMYSIYALTDLFELCFVLIGATLCLPGRQSMRGGVAAR